MSAPVTKEVFEALAVEILEVIDRFELPPGLAIAGLLGVLHALAEEGEADPRRVLAGALLTECGSAEEADKVLHAEHLLREIGAEVLSEFGADMLARLERDALAGGQPS